LPVAQVAPEEHLFCRPIDRRCPGFEDEIMSKLDTSTPRRSGRVFHKMRVQAQGRGHDGRKFRESCETVVVNAHGGLVNLQHEFYNDQILALTNPLTQEEQECRVVYQGYSSERGQRIGVEFLTPAPRFWGVEFATDNTNSPS